MILRCDMPPGYAAAFTTRVGGVSRAPYDSLNLGLLTDDDRGRVTENRRLACAELGLEAERLAMNRQVHGAAVHRARAGERRTAGDGLWTDEPEVPLLALGADCFPIVLARRDRPALAVLHAGRMGLLAGILEAGVDSLGGAGVEAWVGPGIGPCCYEVGLEVAGRYRGRFGSSVVRSRYLDLRRVADRLLRAAGAARVEHLDECTACAPDTFFSHRRDGSRTGRQGVIACIA